MKARRRKILLIVLLLIIIAAVRVYIDNNLIEVSHYTVTSDKIPSSFKGFKILQISDLHSKSFGKSSNKLIKKIAGENPDIVVMTGDMVNSRDTDFEVFINFVEQISKSYDTYYIVGNHEQALSAANRKILTDSLNEFGVRVFDNEKVIITRGTDSINLYGLWFNLRYYKDSNNEYTKDMFFGAEQIQSI